MPPAFKSSNTLGLLVNYKPRYSTIAVGTFSIAASTGNNSNMAGCWSGETISLLSELAQPLRAFSASQARATDPERCFLPRLVNHHSSRVYLHNHCSGASGV